MPSNHETLLRQWNMLQLLPRYPRKITARELTERLSARSFSVSKRTIERDLLELSATFPIKQDDAERPYGWSWDENAKSFDLPGMGTHEALMLATVEQHLKTMLPPSTIDAMAPYFKTARLQLDHLATSRNVRTWSDKIRVVPPTQPLLPPSANEDVLRLVSEALLQEQQLKVSYYKRGSTEDVEYQLHPLALVQRGPVFYLCARIYDYTDVRLLALHRITTAEMLDEKAKMPDDFDLDEAISKGLMGFGEGKMILLRFKLPKVKGDHLYETPLSRDQKIESLDEEVMMVTATVADTPQLIWWLRALGQGVEVLEPKNLKLD